MRIREGCILTATNSSDERVKSLIGCKGALHVVNGEPLRFVVGTNENARSFTTATTKRLGVIGVNISFQPLPGPNTHSSSVDFTKYGCCSRRAAAAFFVKGVDFF